MNYYYNNDGTGGCIWRTYATTTGWSYTYSHTKYKKPKPKYPKLTEADLDKL